MISGQPLHPVKGRPPEVARLHVQRKHEGHRQDHGAAGDDETAESGKGRVDVGDVFEHSVQMMSGYGGAGAGASSSVLRMSTVFAPFCATSMPTIA